MVLAALSLGKMAYSRSVLRRLEIESDTVDPNHCCDDEKSTAERPEIDAVMLLQQEQQLKLLKQRRWLKGSSHSVVPSQGRSVMLTYALLHLTLLLSAAYGFDLEQEEALNQQCPGKAEPFAHLTDSWIPQFKDDSHWLDKVSFLNGDWIAESKGGKSLLPFIMFESAQSVEQLASFWATKVSSTRQLSDKVKVRGTLWLAMTTTRDIPQLLNPSQENRYFQSYPGFTVLSIALEGYYEETDTERLLCMVGCTVRIPAYADLTTAESSSNYSGNLFTWSNSDKDCNYSLQLRYPLKNTLTTPAIRGHLRKLGGMGAVDIQLSSGWKLEVPYSFEAKELVAEARKQMKVDMLNVYKGPDVCSILLWLALQWDGLSVKLNWPCGVSHAFCSQIGPYKDARPYMDITDAKILIKNLRCSDANSSYSRSPDINASPGSRLVSAVIRLQGRFEEKYFAYVKTGCNNGLTLTAEGLWDQDSGLLCMAACRGNQSDMELQTHQREDCDVRVCLYLPLNLTILQRGIVMGNISSMRSYDANDAHSFTQYFYPLSFFFPFNSQLYGMPWKEDLHYAYTKINLAIALLDRYQPAESNQHRLLTKIGLSKYPSLASRHADYSELRSDLVIQTFSKYTSHNDSSLFVGFDLVAIDDVLFSGWDKFSKMSVINSDSTKQQNVLRVAGKLKIGAIANVSTEGLYDPKTGKMYMTGCRSVKEEWFTLSNVTDLDAGLDCSVEVVMQYPAKSLMWIASQSSMKITISSVRPADDPIYFTPLEVVTDVIMYRSQREGIISEKSVEGVLRIVTLSLMLMCILGQGWHMERHPDSVAFVSLLMLGIQAIAFASPLITGVEAMFAADKNDSVSSLSQEGYRSLVYIVRTLSLLCFLLLLRLFERVWSARVCASLPISEVNNVPSEKKICILWALFHVVGLIIVLVSHSRSQAFELDAVEEPRLVASAAAPSGVIISEAVTFAGLGSPDWQKEVLEYGGFIQDLFLLPQAFGGTMWMWTGQPLRRSYYLGITVLRLLPHGYDWYRKSHFFAYLSRGDYMYANPYSDFFSYGGDIVIPLLSLLLALVIWFQQRYSNVQWRSVFSRSGKYLAVPIESELVRRIHRTLSPIPENRPTLGSAQDDH